MIVGRWSDDLRPCPTPRFADVGRLVVRCPDRPGIVAVLSAACWPRSARTSPTPSSTRPTRCGGTFTLRLEFVLAGLAAHRPHLEGALSRWRGSGG